MMWDKAAGLMGKKIKKRTPIEEAREFAKLQESMAARSKRISSSINLSAPGTQRMTWGNRGVGY